MKDKNQCQSKINEAKLISQSDKNNFGHLMNLKKKSEKASHFVAIGASAGCLEALQSLFKCLPDNTGAAYIVVQHLSPQYRSMIADLITRHTSMPVEYVTESIQPKMNCVYLSPPAHIMEMREGQLHIVNTDKHERLYFPIDRFFESLARDKSRKSIAVVLSGTGSDGIHALKAVKEAGGLVIVEATDRFKYDDVAGSSVTNDMADFELPTEKIALNLVKYIQHPYSNSDKTRLKQLLEDNDAQLIELFRLLNREYEIDFSHYKQSTIARRIERRMGIHQIDSLAEYLRLVAKNSQESKKLCQELLIGVTRFFRDPQNFEYLSTKVIPKMLQGLQSGEEFRVWVIGCSTGEETYSLAMEIQEAANSVNFMGDIKIFSTDVDRRAIVDASEGKYGLDIEKDISAAYLEKYFRPHVTHYEISSSLRKLIIFAVHNAITDEPFSNMDLVVCRNTLTYLKPPTQVRVFSAILNALKNWGVLFLGASESTGKLENQFETIDLSTRLYRKKTNIYSSRSDRPALGSLPTVSSVSKTHKPVIQSNRLKEAQDILFKQYIRPSLIIGECDKIEFVYGDISNYVEKVKPGDFRSLYSDVIHSSIRNTVIAAVNRSKNLLKPIHINKVLVDHDSKKTYIEFRIVPLIIVDNAVTYLAIVFSNYEKSRILKYEETDYQGRTVNLERIAQLEQHLELRQEELQAAIKELETAKLALLTANYKLITLNK